MVSIRSGEALLGMGPRAGPRWPGLGGERGLGSPRPSRGEIMLGFRRPAPPPQSSAVRAGAHLPLETVHGLVPTFRVSLVESNFLQPLILQLIQCGWYFLCLDL